MYSILQRETRVNLKLIYQHVPWLHRSGICSKESFQFIPKKAATVLSFHSSYIKVSVIKHFVLKLYSNVKLCFNYEKTSGKKYILYFQSKSILIFSWSIRHCRDSKESNVVTFPSCQMFFILIIFSKHWLFIVIQTNRQIEKERVKQKI